MNEMDFLEYPEPQMYFDVPPSSFGRFRYKSENRKTALEGEGGGPITIKISPDIVENSQIVEVEATLVTRNSQPHWHELKGTKKVKVPTGSGADGLVYFQDLSVIVNKANETNQSKKEDNRVVRLYFEMRFISLTGEEQFGGLLSECIFNSKVEIVDISSCSGHARGGNKLIILCTKARKQCTVVRFHDYMNPLGNQYGWSTDPKMGSYSVKELGAKEITFHQQAAIVIQAPPYHTQEITTPSKVSITIYDKEDQITSRPLDYYYLPNETQVKGESFGRKKRKTQEESVDYFNSYPKLNQNEGSTRSSGSSDFLEQITHSFGYSNLSQSLPSIGLSSSPGPSTSPRSSIVSSPGNFNELKKEDDKSVKYYAATGDVRFLLLSKQKSIQEPDNSQDTPLHHSILSNNYQAFSALCEFATIETINSINSDGETPLHVAVWVRNLEAVKKLQSLKANLTIKDPLGRTAIHLASEINFSDAIRELLKNEKNKSDLLEEVAFDGLTPLLVACSKNFCETVNALVEYGADISKHDPSTGYNTIMYAVKCDSLEMFSALFSSHKITTEIINHQDHFGNTALHLAIQLGRFQLCQKLISFGANPEIHNQYLQNCYMLADEMYIGQDLSNIELILKGFRLYEETSKKIDISAPPRYSLITKESNFNSSSGITQSPSPTIKEEDEWIDIDSKTETPIKSEPMKEIRDLFGRIPSQLGKMTRSTSNTRSATQIQASSSESQYPVEKSKLRNETWQS